MFINIPLHEKFLGCKIIKQFALIQSFLENAKDWIKKHRFIQVTKREYIESLPSSTWSQRGRTAITIHIKWSDC
ncbi:MAG: hypothetical protein ACJAZP_003451 [Psychromonas sp.]|jgi:hypothetical protein